MKRRVKDLDAEWERIANEAIKQAEEVECDLETFLDGLRDISTTILDRWSMG